MKIRFVASLSVLAFSLASIFAASEAEAQQPDGPRFRGGVALEGGGLLVPGSFNFGIIGVQGQLGVQINDKFGVYAVPSFDVVFGSAGGVNFAMAAMFDYTLNDSLTFGAGVDTGSFGVISVKSGTGSVGGGSLYGARLHFGWNPVLERGLNGVRRKALVIGADVRLLSGGTGFVSASDHSASATVSSHAFVLSPALTIGYQAF